MSGLRVAVCAGALAVASGANAGLVFGADAEAQFQYLHGLLGESFLDFESVTAGTNLLPNTDPFGLGVRFASVINQYGVPFGPEHVEVSNLHHPALYGNTICGSPYQYGNDDGRVGYEVRFDAPQRRAGLLRIWNLEANTSFYNSAGVLLGQHQNTTGREFVGWIADSDDPSTWVSRILMDTVVVGGTRQVGYSDNLYFGVNIPTPSSMVLLGIGVGLLWRRRR